MELAEEKIEIKKARGRPRKKLVEVDQEKLSLNTTQNDTLNLQNETSVKINDNSLNAEKTRISFETNSIDVPHTNINQTNVESKHNIEGVNICLEENNDFTPMIKNFQRTSSSERNISSPDVLQVQFNPALVKTYKNRKKEPNLTATTKTADNSKESNEANVNLNEVKTQVVKQPTIFEINPNFIRNTRKKVLKYDVCDLLNKKSHKKIQIEARIDSMPAKTKVNPAQQLNENSNISLSLSNPPVKVIPKINDLPIIIRKNTPSETSLNQKDSPPKIFTVMSDQTSTPKSLIQGKIVSDNRSNSTKPANIESDNLKPIHIKTDIKQRFLTSNCENPPLKKRGRPKKINLSLSLESVPSKQKGEIRKEMKSSSSSFKSVSEVSTDESVKVTKTTKDLLSDSINNLNESKNNIDIRESGNGKLSTESNKNVNTKSVLISKEMEGLKKERESPTLQNLIEIDQRFKTENKTNISSVKYEDTLSIEKNEKEIPFKNSEDLNSSSKLDNKKNLSIRSEEDKINSKKALKESGVLSDDMRLHKNDVSEQESYFERKEVSLENCKTNILENKIIEQIPKETNIYHEMVIQNTHPVQYNIDSNKFSENNQELKSETLAKECQVKHFNLSENLSKFDKTNPVESTEEINYKKDVNLLSIGKEKYIENMETMQKSAKLSDESEICITIKKRSEYNDVSDILNKSNNQLTATKENLPKKKSDFSSTTLIQVINDSSESDKLKEKLDVVTKEPTNLKSEDGISISKECANKQIPVMNIKQKEQNTASEPLKALKPVETSIQNTSKPKELKTGLDIWLEKVQIESKMKNFVDSGKKFKYEKSHKNRSRDELKLKSETKKTDTKICDKLKEGSLGKEENQKILSKPTKKDFKDKSDTKTKTKSKEDSKYVKDYKDKRNKEKEENKSKNDFKTEPAKSKSDSFASTKLQTKEKERDEHSKNKASEITKMCKNDSNFMTSNKNENSLRTIDIFNFAAKDEMAQKTFKKKSKKSEPNLISQEKINTTSSKQDVTPIKIEMYDEKDFKKGSNGDKYKSTSKEKRSERKSFVKKDPDEKILEKEINKKKSELLIDDVLKGSKKKCKLNEEETEVSSFNSEISLDQTNVSIEKMCEKSVIVDSTVSTKLLSEVDLGTEGNFLGSKLPHISDTLPTKSVPFKTIQDENFSLLTAEKSILDSAILGSQGKNENNIKESVKIEENIFETNSVQTNITKEINAINENSLDRVKLNVPKVIESLPQASTETMNDSISNEVFDPLKDIESFLEAAGNLLSRSHSSDDEKDSISRRNMVGGRKTSLEVLDEKNSLNSSSNEKEKVEQNDSNTISGAIEDLKSSKCEPATSENDNTKQNLKVNVTDSEKATLFPENSLNEKSKMSDSAILSSMSEQNTTSELKNEKESQEEWFTEIDKNIEKDLVREVPYENNQKKENQLAAPRKTGPRTPPLPPPPSSLDIDDFDRSYVDETSYSKNNFDNEIVESIISTSIRIPNSLVSSLHELKFMAPSKTQNKAIDEQLQLAENQIIKKTKKKNETSLKDKELKKLLKSLKKTDLTGDWKKTYKEIKKMKKKSVECLPVSKSSLEYSPENEHLVNEEESNNNSTIRRSHRLKSIALQQQNQQLPIGRGGLVRNDYEDSFRADLAQVQEQNTKFLKTIDSINQFKQITENEYKCERVISKEAKRMICDCFLTKDEEERGEYGCGEDCLNRLLMIECGPNCSVGDRCTNKRFQRGQYAPCRVFMTEKKGCGIFAEVEIPAGEFIMEYVGEVVDSEQFEKRAAEYSASKNKHFYFMSLRSNAIIDATGRGNISRFINHSCDPNAETQKWTVNGELRIGFFTTRTVSPGEEITFDYQFQRYGKQAQKCFCEAATCRGWIGEEPDSDEEIEDEIDDSLNKDNLENVLHDESFTEKGKINEEKENLIEKASHVKLENLEIDKSKSALTDEELKLKQQQREQRKKDKQRKREIRLAQQKHEFLEDPDLEDEIYRISRTGLKNQLQTLRLSRLIVRAKLKQTRLNLLEILRAGEIPCRRLFLDYHGLKLLHGWMTECEIKEPIIPVENLRMRLAILDTLHCLPIPNKTMLKDSKVYQIVHNWSQDKISLSPTDGSASDSNSGHASSSKENSINDLVMDTNQKELYDNVKDLALKLLRDWEVLPEVFRIPRKERVEQMKEHEREADRRPAGIHVDDEQSFQVNRERFKKSRWDSNTIKPRWQNKLENKDRRNKIGENEKFDDGLTKEQRRQAFEAKVAQDEAEKLNAEKRRSIEFEARREFEFKCKFFMLDSTKIHPRDIPFCVDQNTNTWYTMDKRKIPVPPSHIHVKIPPKHKSTNPADYKLPTLDLPPGWKFAIEPIHGRIYYYHVKIRRPQWEPPPKIFPLVNPDTNNLSNNTSGLLNISTICSNSSDSSGSENESLDDVDAKSLLVQERAISPRKEEDRLYNQIEMRRYKENKEKIRKRKEEIKKRKNRLLLKIDEQQLDSDNSTQLHETDPLPIADYLISSDEDDDALVEELDSKLIEKIVKGESIVDELDALKHKKPLKRPLPIKDKPNISNNSSLSGNSNYAEYKKRSKTEEKKIRGNDDFKKSKSSSKNKYYARRAKEKFRADIAGIIVHHLQPYRKENCQVGKITTTEDFKHLARKLTHFVMIKELKHCDSTGQTLVVTDSVKNKSREFIKKYMAKYGEIYIRPASDPEYKEIPI